MILTIWRHGEAGSARTDCERELTPRGVADIQLACPKFAGACEARGIVPPSLLLHSPWLRTQQTAAIIVQALSSQMQSVAALQPDGDIPDVEASLLDLSADGDEGAHFVLVSHQPLVSYLLDYFLGDGSSVAGLSPGAFAVLDMPVLGQACAHLQFWGLPPHYDISL